MIRHSSVLAVVVAASILGGAHSFAAARPSITEAPFGKMPDGTLVQCYLSLIHI